MSILQAQPPNSRGTMSSLTNAAMYLGEAIGGIFGGILIKNLTGFYGVVISTVIGVSLAMLLYTRQGYFRRQ